MCATTIEPVLWSPRAAAPESMSRGHWSPCTQGWCSAARDAAAVSSRTLQLEKALMATKTQIRPAQINSYIKEASMIPAVATRWQFSWHHGDCHFCLETVLHAPLYKPHNRHEPFWHGVSWQAGCLDSLVTLDIPEGGPLSKGSALEGSEPRREGERRPCGLITDAPFQETLTPRPVFSQYY